MADTPGPKDPKGKGAEDDDEAVAEYLATLERERVRVATGEAGSPDASERDPPEPVPVEVQILWDELRTISKRLDKCENADEFAKWREQQNTLLEQLSVIQKEIETRAKQQREEHFARVEAARAARAERALEAAAAAVERERVLRQVVADSKERAARLADEQLAQSASREVARLPVVQEQNRHAEARYEVAVRALFFIPGLILLAMGQVQFAVIVLAFASGATIGLAAFRAYLKGGG